MGACSAASYPHFSIPVGALCGYGADLNEPRLTRFARSFAEALPIGPQRERRVNGIGIDLDFSAAAVAFGPPPILVFLIAVIVNSLLSGAVRGRLPLILRPLALADQLAGELERPPEPRIP